MVQIIQENRKPTRTEQFNQSLKGIGDVGKGLAGITSQSRSAQKQASALKGQGIDPSVMNLPREAQAAYFKNQFIPEKKLTPLQESQKNLAEQRLQNLQSEERHFNQIYDDENNPDIIEEIFEITQKKSPIARVPENKLRKLAAFQGQPGRKGIMGNEAQAELDRLHKEKIESPEYQRDIALSKSQAQSDSKFYQDLNERKSKQILKKESLERLKALGKKRVTGKIWESVADRMGLTQLTSDGYREYTAEQKNQFTDFKAIAGSQLSAREFFTLASAYPNANFSPEANEAIIRNLEAVHDTLDKEEEFAKELRKENKGKIPEFFQEKVNSKLQNYVAEKAKEIKENTIKIMNAQYGISEGHTLMFDPETGDALNVPDDKVFELLSDGLADLP